MVEILVTLGLALVHTGGLFTGTQPAWTLSTPVLLLLLLLPPRLSLTVSVTAYVTPGVSLSVACDTTAVAPDLLMDCVPYSSFQL